MKIFITGSTGYIGHGLTTRALEKGFSVVALVRTKSYKFPAHPSLSVHEGDVTDYTSIVEGMKGCDLVVHAAALTQFWHKDLTQFDKINVQGTRNVLEAALQTGVKKVVFTSSCAVLGPSFSDPVPEDHQRISGFENEYEVTKHQAEELAKAYAAKGLHVVIVRPPRVFGPGLLTKGNPINRLIQTIVKTGFAFLPAAKNIVGNYAYINDVVEGHFLALEKGKSSEAYHLGGENVSYQNLFATIAASADRNIITIPIPVYMLKGWASLVFGIHLIIRRHTHLSPKVIDRLVQNRAVSCEKAIRDLGYRITPFKEAIAATVRHLQRDL